MPASNEMITYTYASNNFAWILPPIFTNQMVTKSEALARYAVEAAPMASYADNQLVPFSQWVAGPS